MLIIAIAIAAWITVLLIVAAMGVAASRGDDALESAIAADRRELRSGIVLRDWSGAPLLAPKARSRRTPVGTSAAASD
jgi:hypothetical protein